MKKGGKEMAKKVIAIEHKLQQINPEKEQEMRRVLGQELEISELVEERLQETYRQIAGRQMCEQSEKREKEGNRQMNGNRKYVVYKRGVAVAAITVALVTSSVGVLAATGFFQKEIIQEGDSLTYEFAIDYDLQPGVYEVTPNYLPEGYVEFEENKYYDATAVDDENMENSISILPVYNTEELDRIGKTIAVSDVDSVEKTTLSGMEANVVTYKSNPTFEGNQNIFLFNSTEGYVIRIYGGAKCSTEELKKVADNLTVTRTGDADFETEEERTARQQEELNQEKEDQLMADTMDQAVEAGIPEEKLLAVGEETEEWKLWLGMGMGYTVTGYEYFDSIADYEKEGFWDYEDLAEWLNEDGTLKPYERLCLDEQEEIIAQETVESEFLRVDVTAHRYDAQWPDNSMALYAHLVDVAEREDGSLTWNQNQYEAAAGQDYELQMDQMPIYISQPENVDGEERNQFFYRDMEVGDEITYSLIFVVDKDREGSQVLEFPLADELQNATTLEELYDSMVGYNLLSE